jgi:hypothetical protein
MNINPNIDEMLTGFIDGELTDSQQIEVQRMVSNDPQVAGRLRQLQNCRNLINSLPPAEAPAEILEQIKSTLERKTLLSEQTVTLKTARGARHLMARKVMAAAIMIGLFVGLAAVIYTIVAPVSPYNRGRAFILERTSRPSTGVEKTRPSYVVASGSSEFCGRLELKTNTVAAMGAFISRAIEDNGLSGYVKSTGLPGRKIYTISCSKEALAPLLADMTGIWQKFGSATLFVETEKFASPVTIGEVSPQQITEIVNQAGSSECAELARDFSVLNNAASLSAVGGLAAAGGTTDAASALTNIPKPVLTGGLKPNKPPAPAQGEPKVNLTIVLVGSN